MRILFSIEDKDIYLTRGDSFCLALRFTGRTLPATAQALFTVKRRVRDEGPVLCKRAAVQDNVALIKLFPDDTAALPAGPYVWDTRLLLPGQEVKEVRTPMEYASFQLLEVIGDAN